MSALFVVLVLLLGVAHASVVAKPEGDCPPPIGSVLRPRMQAPTFTANAVLEEEFIKYDSADAKAKKQWLVLIFYPLDFTFVCPTELVAFSEAVPKLRSLDTQVAAISTDSHFTHLAWVRTPRAQGGLGKIDLPLVADISKDISRRFGVLVENPEDELYGAALRAIFIIDPKGKIRSVQVNDEAVGRSVDEVVRLIQAFQYADSHGEGCPANWKPGDATITPNPKGSQKFFTTWSEQHKEL